MLVPRLLKKNSLTFTRTTTDTGYYDDQGGWVEGTPEPNTIETTGNLQPFRQGKERTDLPSGIYPKHIKIYYTVTELLGYDDITNQEADRTTIDGIPFVVYDVEDWSTPAYRCAHYKVYLVREDKL